MKIFSAWEADNAITYYIIGWTIVISLLWLNSVITLLSFHYISGLLHFETGQIYYVISCDRESAEIKNSALNQSNKLNAMIKILHVPCEQLTTSIDLQEQSREPYI